MRVIKGSSECDSWKLETRRDVNKSFWRTSSNGQLSNATPTYSCCAAWAIANCYPSLLSLCSVLLWKFSNMYKNREIIMNP